VREDMLEIDETTKKLIKINETDLKEQNLLERYHLQEAIVNSWDVFTKEIGLPEIKLIGKEITPHKSVKDRIDIVAFDENDSTIVIFELKRDKERTQLLQSISYAGMVYTWTPEDIIDIIKNDVDKDELKELFQNEEIDIKIKIVLIAENFDPEIIYASHWLKTAYKLNISAYTVRLYNHNNNILLDIEQKYPLKELSDVYESRRKKTTVTKEENKSWDDVKVKLEYDFGRNAVDHLLKNCTGDVIRKRFFSSKSRDGIDNIIIKFNNKYINIYSTVKDKENGKEILYNVFGNNLEINEWAQGLSFNITKEEEFSKLMRWLEI
jgi:hypothetical protein